MTDLQTIAFNLRAIADEAKAESKRRQAERWPEGDDLDNAVEQHLLAVERSPSLGSVVERSYH